MKKSIALLLMLTFLSSCGSSDRSVKKVSVTPQESFVFFDDSERLFLPPIELKDNARFDPFGLITTEHALGITDYALSDLRWVGALDVNGDQWELFQTPDGHVHRARVGDPIGDDGARVVGLDLACRGRPPVPALSIGQPQGVAPTIKCRQAKGN